MPSWKQVYDGLISEETSQIMNETRGSKEDRKDAVLKRALGVWDLIFGLLGIDKSTEPIPYHVLTDANHPTTSALFQIYSLEFWLFNEINKASRAKDNKKVSTLGPFATILSVALDHAQKSRQSYLSESMIYKPFSLPKNKANFIELYKKRVGKPVYFNGVVSAT